MTNLVMIPYSPKLSMLKSAQWLRKILAKLFEPPYEDYQNAFRSSTARLTFTPKNSLGLVVADAVTIAPLGLTT
jgi:hypothetical protein